MNWAPEAVKAEMDYRVERALDLRGGTTGEHLRAVRHQHRSWWRRRRAADTYDESGSPKAA